MTGRIKSIGAAWDCCAYKYKVEVSNVELSDTSEVLDTLAKFFGDAVYFWGYVDRATGDDVSLYLCKRK